MTKIILKDIPDLHKIDVYEANGGYQSIRKAIKEMSPDDVTNVVKSSNLRGRGGACFSDWSEMDIYAQANREAKISLLQR